MAYLVWREIFFLIQFKFSLLIIILYDDNLNQQKINKQVMKSKGCCSSYYIWVDYKLHVFFSV